jgi:hypothetical protein
VVQDVLFRNNLVRNAASGFGILTSDDLRPSQPTKRIAIVNNLWLGLTRRFFGMVSGPGGPLDDLVIDHNTAVPAGYSAYHIEAGIEPALIRFRLTNNVLGFGAFGVSFPKADGKLARKAPGAIIARNALGNFGDTGDGQGARRNLPHLINQAMYTSFLDAPAAGINPDDGTLTARSPMRRAGTDGKDIGVDFDELQAARRAQSGQR